MTTAAETQMMYANKIGYTDITPFEIIRRVSDKTIEIREMAAVRDPDFKLNFIVGGFSANCDNQSQQKWVITSDESNPIIRIRLQKNGQYKDNGGDRYKLADQPQKFYDYNF